MRWLASWLNLYRVGDEVEVLDRWSSPDPRWVRGRIAVETLHGYRVDTVDEWSMTIEYPKGLRHIDPILAASREEAAA